MASLHRPCFRPLLKASSFYIPRHSSLNHLNAYEIRNVIRFSQHVYRAAGWPSRPDSLIPAHQQRGALLLHRAAQGHILIIQRRADGRFALLHGPVRDLPRGPAAELDFRRGDPVPFRVEDRYG
jgi:hypothetical protein